MTYPVLRLSHVASIKTSNVDKKSYDGEVTVRLCNYTDVYKNNIITSDMDFMVATATPDQIGKFGLKVGDTVFTKDSEAADDIGIPAYIGGSTHDLVCGYHLAIARPLRGTADPRFLYWCLASPATAQQWSVLASGVTRVGLRQADIGKLEIPVPSLQTQREVAAFLDQETAQIDDLIGKQERLIELLAEKRQAIITHAVTKGLDPTTPTKPSGLPWLDEVPASWAVSSIKHEWRVIDCKHITAEFVDAGVPLASIREVQGKFVNLDTAKRTTMTFYESMIEGNREPKVGDLIFSRNATVGEVAIVPSALEPFAMGQDVCLLKRRSTAASPDFGWYAMRSRYIQEQITLAMIGSTFKRINVEEIRSLTYCAPPLDEQRAIAKYLDERVSGIDKVVSSAATAVGLLRERRSALISAAVTGKIKVTNEGVAA